MIKVVSEHLEERFEGNCNMYISEGYKLSSSSCGYVPAPYDCNYYIAVFYKED